MLPVISLNTNYYKPAKYDDLLSLKTTVINIPTVKIKFHFEIHNENKELLTTSEATLAFINSKTKRPTRAPEYLIKKLKEVTD
jgi:acyl-CoA thioester hydrolase